MPNPGDGLRTDQSIYPGYRTPSREAERQAWYDRRDKVLELIVAGHNSSGIGAQMFVSPVTVRHWMQRMYNEAELPAHQRTQAALIAAAYRLGWLTCQCSP